jgi:hypothetical protein
MHLRLLILYDLNALEQAQSPDIPDKRKLAELLQVFGEVPAGFVCVLLEFLVVEDVEDCAGGCHGHGVAAVSAEELDVALAEGLGDLFSADHSSHWKAIAHGLPTGHDIRDNSVMLESPEMGADSAEACLDLVGDRYDVVRVQNAVDLFEEVGEGDDLAGAALQDLADEGAGVRSDDGL